jgi:hypothetical protein
MGGPVSDAAWNHQLMLDREREAVEALNRCVAAGADPDAIRTLARECGIDIKYITLTTRQEPNHAQDQ